MTYKTNITQSNEFFQIEANSLIDESNTYTKLGYRGQESIGFHLNSVFSISNNGPKRISNPRISVNGSGKWYSIEAIIAYIKEKYCPANDKEKLLAVWRFFCETLADSRGGMALSADPVITLNSLGYAGCYHLSLMMLTVYKHIGFEKVRLVQIGNLDHWLPEVWYNDKYHMADACLHVFFPDENGDVAGIDDLQNNYALTKNIIHHNGPAGYDAEDRIYAKDYYESFLLNDQVNVVPQTLHTPITADYTLRPHEKMMLYWQSTDKFIKINRRNNESNLTTKPYYGSLIYEPDYGKTSWLEGVDMHRNVSVDPSGMLIPSVSNKKCEIIYNIQTPYAVTGACLELEITKSKGQNVFAVDILTDDPKWKDFGLEKWQQIYLLPQDDIGGKTSINLTSFIDETQTKLIFSYFVRISMTKKDESIIGIKNLKLKTDMQCAPQALPSLKCGRNYLIYTDASEDIQKDIEVLFQLHENTNIDPPQIPLIEHPPCGGQLSDIAGIFSWKINSENIIDYHIQVSEYCDFRWPISPNFDRYLSRTKFAGQLQWAPLRMLELKHGFKYYWRIRAKNQLGIWSQWSTPANFKYNKQL